MKIIITSLLVIIYSNLFGQEPVFQWTKAQGGSQEENGKSIAVDAEGNSYITGYFQGTVDFDPGSNVYNLTSAGSYEIFITKLDNNGSFIWAKRIGGASNNQAYCIKLDNSGNIYITGLFYGIVDFNPGPGIYNLNSSFGADGFIVKLDNLGNFLWAKQIDSVSNLAEGYSIEIDDNNNVLILGRFGGTVDFDFGTAVYNLTSNGLTDVFVLKITNLGEFLWAKQLGGSSEDWGISIALDSNENTYITGDFQGTGDFDPGTNLFNLNSAGSRDIFISKLDHNGDFVWAKQIGGIYSDKGNSIKVDDLGNVYATGSFGGTVDFNPNVDIFNLSSGGLDDVFILKLNSLGEFVWANKAGSVSSDYGYDVTIDNIGNVYATGSFNGTVDFDSGINVNNLVSNGGSDIFISKIDTDGNFISALQIGGTTNDEANSIFVDLLNNIYLTGKFSNTCDFDPNISATFNLTSDGMNDIFIQKFVQKGVVGKMYLDLSQNCLQESDETGLLNRKAIINPGNILVETNDAGIWYIDSLPLGSYEIIADTTGNWILTCPITQSFVVASTNSINDAPDFGLITTEPCTEPIVSIIMPFMRPGFGNQKVYVNACNDALATETLYGAFVEVKLNDSLIVESATLPFTIIGDNVLRFELGDLSPGECVSFNISCYLGVDVELGQTLCMEANLYPVADCVLDTIPAPPTGEVSPCTLPWDQSSLSVEGWCANDSIYFTITNTGELGGGDMECYSPVRIFVDGVLIQLDSILLQGGETFTYFFLGTGQTWILQADQHPLHPGNSHPNAHVENCGSGTWTPDLVNDLPLDDADPVADIYCGVVTGSYDPNDKRGFPSGVSDEHFIAKNQDLEYIIRFQNTGTDTAFTVVVRDTLDENFNIFTVTPGVSSHPYSFRMYGPRVMEWTFANILLPDSTTNEPLSNGFLTFTVKQNPDLAEGTVLSNDADIYFDFNDPIITNETEHTISYQINNMASLEKLKTQKSNLKLYPNPTNSSITIDLNNFSKSVNYKIYTLSGKLLQEKRNYYGQKISVDVKNLENGLYFIEIEHDTKIEVLNFVKN